jgi:hypothetical protein
LGIAALVLLWVALVAVPIVVLIARISSLAAPPEISGTQARGANGPAIGLRRPS